MIDTYKINMKFIKNNFLNKQKKFFHLFLYIKNKSLNL
jgi:hypothetical protein